MSGPIRIAIVSDRPRIRLLVTSCIERDSKLQLACTASISADVESQVLESRPDVVLLDVQESDGRAVEIAKRLRDRSVPAKVVFVGDSEAELCSRLAGMLNSHGYITIDEASDVWSEQIQRIAAGLEGSVVAPFASRKDDRLALESLTKKEVEVLRLLSLGDGVKETAIKLGLSPKTVDNRKYRIMQKLGIHDRVYLTRFAIRVGLIKP